MTDVGSQVIDITGAITDDWGKVYWTLGGTNPSFDFILALGIST